jgi:hypothetical protein
MPTSITNCFAEVGAVARIGFDAQDILRFFPTQVAEIFTGVGVRARLASDDCGR